MRFLSWDIGIKNLSYCWIEYQEPEKKFKVLNWEIINLMNPEKKEQNYYCMGYKKDGVKCEKKATWYHKLSYMTYCQTHRKKFPIEEMMEIKKNTCSHILVNKKERCQKKIKYVTNNSLVGYCEIHHKKYESCYLEKIDKKKKAKNEMLVISTNLIKELDKRKEMLESDYILIENQPAFKNPKMKSIQMIVYTYYLIRSKIDANRMNQKICFLMASNKLKVKLETDEIKDAIISKIHQKTKDKYRRHKELSKEYCCWFLKKQGANYENNEPNWLVHYQKHKKQDDLADTYLMCVYCQQNSNIF